MSVKLEQYDVAEEKEMQEQLHFHKGLKLRNVDKVFKAEITNVIKLTEKEKLFQIRLLNESDRQRFDFMPGQFVMVEVPGYGEIPLSISSSPSQHGVIELCIRNSGTVTGVLHRACRGARIGIRGPFGTHFPMEKMKGSNILLIAGGLGLAPLRAPILHVAENRPDYGQVRIMYGTTDPSQLLFNYQYEQWKRIDGVDLSIIVQNPDENWKGPTGLITQLLEDPTLPIENTYAIVCGPPVMFKFVCGKLSQLGAPMNRMFVSLERRMHCGMGKCCRCNVGSTYVCLEGPVFDFWTVMNLKEAI